MKPPIDPSWRYPLRQLRQSVRLGRTISWPVFRRLAMRSGVSEAVDLQTAWRRLAGR